MPVNGPDTTKADRKAAKKRAKEVLLEGVVVTGRKEENPCKHTGNAVGIEFDTATLADRPDLVTRIKAQRKGAEKALKDIAAGRTPERGVSESALHELRAKAALQQLDPESEIAKGAAIESEEFFGPKLKKGGHIPTWQDPGNLSPTTPKPFTKVETKTDVDKTAAYIKKTRDEVAEEERKAEAEVRVAQAQELRDKFFGKTSPAEFAFEPDSVEEDKVDELVETKQLEARIKIFKTLDRNLEGKLKGELALLGVFPPTVEELKAEDERLYW